MNSKANYAKVSNGVSIISAGEKNRGDEENLSNDASSYGSASSLPNSVALSINKKTTPKPSPAPTRTVLKYSDKNTRFIFEQKLSDSYDGDLLASNSLELHFYVFHNQVDKVKEHIDKLKRKHNNQKQTIADNLSIKDLHDNTPLHLCCMLGNLEIAKFLISEGAIVKSRNKQMWTPLNEAISYGDRDLIKHTLKKFEEEVDKIMDDTKPKVIEALLEMDDFYVEILVSLFSKQANKFQLTDLREI